MSDANFVDDPTNFESKKLVLTYDDIKCLDGPHYLGTKLIDYLLQRFYPRELKKI
jgi:hypothetical protein